MKVLENEILAKHTTFKLGGPARFFIEVQDEQEIGKAIHFARENALPFFILGRGSNVIFADQGFAGVVICPKLKEINWLSEDKLYVGVSVRLDDLVDECWAKTKSGLEWAAGIPGTVGGAIWGNAGANRGEMKDIVNKVRVMKEEGRIEEIEKNQCQFDYRTSIFKKKNWVILGAELTFNIQHLTFKIKELASQYRQARQEKHPLEYPSAGSIFKNVPVEEIPKECFAKFTDSIKTDPFPVVPAAKIIAEAKLAGARIGDAQVSTKHTNFIINLGQAKSDEVLALIEKVKSVVKEKFDIQLKVEPIIVDRQLKT